MIQLESIFRFIVIVSIYSSILGLTLLLLKALLRNKLSPKWHYALWLVLILKLMIPFGPASGFSVANILNVDYRISAIETAIEPHATDNSAMKTSVEVGKFPDYGGVSNNVEAFNQKMNQELPKVATVQPGIKTYAALLWVAGFLVLSLWFLGAGMIFRKRLKGKASETPIPVEVFTLLESAKEKMGLRGPITLLCGKGISTPATYGIFQKRILLGEENLEMDKEALSYVLLHELAHIKRRDPFVNFLLILLTSIHWFNPILWICFGKIRQEMEQATDQLALSKLKKEQHKSYALALLEVLENLNQKPRVAGYLGLVDNKKSLEERIRRIKMNQFFNSKKKSMLAIGLVCMLALSGVFLTNGIEGMKVEAESLSTGPIKMPYPSYNGAALYKYKNTKLGEKAKIKALLKALPTGSTGKTTFYTGKKTFGIRYEFDKTLLILDNDSEHTGMKSTLRKNAVILFTLIPSLDYLEIEGLDKTPTKLTRKELQKEYKMEFAKIGLSEDTFEEFLRYLSLVVKTSPEAYTPSMSSVPGIAIMPSYAGIADKIVYNATYGQLLEWGTDGKITELGRKTEKGNNGDIVFWSPLNQLATSYVPSAMEVKVEIFKGGKKLTEQVLRFDDSATGMYKLIEIKNDKFQDLY